MRIREGEANANGSHCLRVRAKAPARIGVSRPPRLTRTQSSWITLIIMSRRYTVRLDDARGAHALPSSQSPHSDDSLEVIGCKRGTKPRVQGFEMLPSRASFPEWDSVATLRHGCPIPGPGAGDLEVKGAQSSMLLGAAVGSLRLHPRYSHRTSLSVGSGEDSHQAHLRDADGDDPSARLGSCARARSFWRGRPAIVGWPLPTSVYAGSANSRRKFCSRYGRRDVQRAQCQTWRPIIGYVG